MKKKHWKSYLVYSGVALLIFVAGAASGNLFSAQDLKQAMHVLSDAFLFPAVALGGIGALSFVAKEGIFDLMGYAFSMLFNRFIHPQNRQEAYYDYKMRKEEKRNGWLLEALVVGFVCFAASVLCLVIYMMQ